MTLTTSIYRRAAVFLWGAVSLVIGISIGFYFGMSEKKILFVTVVAVGLYVMILMRMSNKNKSVGIGEDTSSKQMVDEQFVKGEGGLGLNDNKGEEYKGKVAVMNTDGKKIVDNDSREWLDDFLIKQQKD